MTIKPIETIAYGCRFRSRLEARWAVFFQSLRIPWEYEKEGFDIHGHWYLPDFYLPDIDTWVEIKPGNPDDWPDHIVFDSWPESDEEWESWPFRRFVLIVGNPWYDATTHNWSYQGYVRGDNGYVFCECQKCGKVGIQYGGRSDRVCGDRCFPDTDRGCNYDNLRLIQAYLMARQARFEHGEVV